MRSLPSDVLLDIVDLVQSDLPTLSRCARTCRLLLDYARPSLFRTVVLEERSASHSTLTLGARLSILGAALERNPTLARLVRALVVRGESLRPLPSLGPGAVLPLCRALGAGGLERLALERVSVGGCGLLLEVVTALPALRALEMRDVAVGEDRFRRPSTGGVGSEARALLVRFPPLERMTVRAVYDSETYDGLVQLACMWASGMDETGERRLASTLRALDVKLTSGWIKFVRLVGTGLQELAVEGQTENRTSSAPEPLVRTLLDTIASSCPALHTLRLELVPGPFERGWETDATRDTRRLAVSTYLSTLSAVFPRTPRPFPELRRLSLVLVDRANEAFGVTEGSARAFIESLRAYARYPGSKLERVNVLVRIQRPRMTSRGSGMLRSWRARTEDEAQGDGLETDRGTLQRWRTLFAADTLDWEWQSLGVEFEIGLE